MIRVQAAMMHKSVVSLLLIQGVALLKADSALVIGGFGASDSVQVVTDNDVCLGGNAVPMIPKAPDGRVGWTAQYVDGKVVVCGGAKVDFYSDCYSLQIGTKNLSKAERGRPSEASFFFSKIGCLLDKILRLGKTFSWF